MYFRPSAERGRTPMIVSFGSGWMFCCSLIVTSATAFVSPFTVTTFGFISETVPTRKPPSRISFPRTSFWPLGSSAFSS